MSSAIPLRRRAVLWLVPPALVLLIIVNNVSQTSIPLPGFWTWTVAHSVLLLIVPAAVAATGAALEAARLRLHAVENTLNIRNPLSVILNALWPSYVAGLLLQGCAVGIVALGAWGGASPVPWGLLLAIAAIMLFHTSAGFLMGSLLRPMIGVPVALALSYSWLGFTGTFGWFPPRHLAGLVLETCCFYDEQPHPLSVLAAVLFGVLASTAFCLWAAYALRLLPSNRAQRITIPALLLAVATTVGLMVAANLTGTSAEPRDPADLRCSTDDVVVCLYPEQLAAEDPTVPIQQMIGHLRSQGVDVPHRVVAGPAGQVDDELRFRFVPGMTRTQLAGSLASSFQGDQWLLCPSEPLDRTIGRQEAGDAARVWLAMQMTGAPTEGATDDPLVRSLSQAPDDAQASWINTALASMDDCAVDPPGMLQ